MLTLHVLFGLLGICSGAVALGIAKGSRIHIRSGKVFVWTMLLMAGTGLILTVVRENSFSRLNGVAATLTAYLVLTGWLAIRRGDRGAEWPDHLLSAVAVCIVVVSMSFGFEVTAAVKGPPAPAFFIFGAFALLALAGDIHKVSRGLTGTGRLARHLWRMGAAMWIATASFFLGQARVFPDFLRKPSILALPPLIVLIVVVYWVVRTMRKTVRVRSTPI